MAINNDTGTTEALRGILQHAATVVKSIEEGMLKTMQTHGAGGAGALVDNTVIFGREISDDYGQNSQVAQSLGTVTGAGGEDLHRTDVAAGAGMGGGRRA